MGYNKTSEAGFNLFATSIFLFGCNMRCPYCMNGRIVVVKPEDWDKPVKTVPLEIVKEHVFESGTKWVMISGGEPLLTPLEKLHNLLDEIHSWDCNIGISTNGTYPELLSQIINKIDYVAMDLKSDSPKIYSKTDIKNGDKSFSKMIQTKCMLYKQKMEREDFDYEIRTTLYPEFFNINSVENIAGIIRPEEKWVFQQFRHAKNMLDETRAKSIEPFSPPEIKSIIKKAKKHSKHVRLRYV